MARHQLGLALVAALSLCASLCAPLTARAQLRIMPPSDLAPVVESSGYRGQDGMAVAFDGQGYFVVWTDWREHETAGAISGARVSRSGERLDAQAIVVSDEPRSQLEPSVAWVAVHPRLGARVLEGVYVLADGTPLLGGPLTLTPGLDGHATHPALATVSDSSFLLAYSAFDPRPTIASSRPFARFVVALPEADGGSSGDDGGAGAA